MDELKEIKVVKARAEIEEKLEPMQAKISVVRLEGVDHFYIECPNPQCKFCIYVPMATIRLLVYKKIHKNLDGVI